MHRITIESEVRQIRGACPLECPDMCSWIVTVKAGELLIHPDDARLRSSAAGDDVRVGNARGSFFAVADVTDCIRPGVVASTKGRWPCHSKENATVNATVDVRDSDMDGGAVYHDNRVRVDKAS